MSELWMAQIDDKDIPALLFSSRERAEEFAQTYLLMRFGNNGGKVQQEYDTLFFASTDPAIGVTCDVYVSAPEIDSAPQVHEVYAQAARRRRVKGS